MNQDSPHTPSDHAPSEPKKPVKSKDKKPSVPLICAGLVVLFILGMAVFLIFPEAVGRYLQDVSPGVNTLSTIVIALFTFALWLSTDAMQETTTATLEHLKKEFEAEHRPWISVTVEPDEPLVFLADGTGFSSFLFGFNNSGRVPAIDLRLKYAIVPPNGDAVTVQRTIADEMRTEPTKGWGEGISAFPGNAATMRVPHNIPADIVQGWRSYLTDHEPHPIPNDTHIVGCVTYGSPLTTTRYETGFIRELRRTRPTASGPWPITPDENSTPADRLETTGSRFGSGAIS